jgi:hypothetical protein
VCETESTLAVLQPAAVDEHQTEKGQHRDEHKTGNTRNIPIQTDNDTQSKRIEQNSQQMTAKNISIQ